MSIEQLMWVEKYRPKRLDDVVNQKEIVEGIKRIIASPAGMPNMLFAGPAGVGKTTVALCIAREVLGEYWRDYTLELNASDERGINMVREKVKMFTRYTSIGSIPFKIVILDEADEMTPEAQTALRRIMEDSASTSRFILICNYISQIIGPIQSRCVIFRFKSLARDDVVNHLANICKLEGVRYEDKALEMIYEFTSGDLRHAINILQAAASHGTVNDASVRSALGISYKARVGEVIRLALEGNFNDARLKMLELTKVHGLSERDFIKFASEEIIKGAIKDAGANTKGAELLRILAEYDYRLVVGAHPDIQLAALLAELARIGKASSGGRAVSK